MAEEATIGGLIERIKAEGSMTRNGLNSLKSVNVTLKTFQPVLDSMRNSLLVTNIELFTIRSILAEANELTKEQIEDMRRRDDLAVKPEKSSSSDSTGASPSPVAGSDPGTLNLGLLATGLAASIGATIGVLAGQVKTIQAFSKILAPNALSERIGKSIRGFAAGVSMNFDLFKATINERITAVRASVTSGLERVKAFLSIGEDSKLGKAIASFKSFFSPITELFTTAGKTLAELVPAGGGAGGGVLSKMMGVLELVGGYFKSMGVLVGKVAGVVGKIFAPIAVVLTLFDTVKGAMDGYAEEGSILGGLEGAINGFFTSLITKPLDLVKDAAAWVIGKFGFDAGAEALKSFSFTELFTSITGAIFDGVSGVVNVIKDLFTFGEEEKTLLGGIGKLVDILNAPLNMAINFVRGMFGFSEDRQDTFKIQDFIAENFGAAMTWISEKISGVMTAVKDKFSVFGDYISTIPDRVTYAAKEMFINVKAKLEKGFLMFGEWFASIPDRIKVAALETIRSIPGGGLIVGEDDVNQARAAVTNRTTDLDARIQAVESRRLSQLAELEKSAPANNIVAPTTINNGGNTTNSTVNNYYSYTSPASTVDPSLPDF